MPLSIDASIIAQERIFGYGTYVGIYIFIFGRADGECPAREDLPEGDPSGIVQIVHGIAEHIARYSAFAAFLAEHGYIVVCHDQLGHGKRSASDEAHLGFFSEENGWEKAVAGYPSLHDKTAAKYPGKPYFIFGHSIGSFLTRTYLIRFRTGLDGAVISGTGHQSPALVSAGKVMSAIDIRPERVQYHERYLLDKIAFGTCQRQV